MQSAKLVLPVVFLLTLCSGVVAGVLVSRLPTDKNSSPARNSTELQAALGLTPDQQEKMKSIWEGTRATVDDCVTKARDIQREQDEALSSLLTEDQKAKFKKIQSDFRHRSEDLKKTEEQAIHQAVQQTDQLLDESQRKQYHAIIDQRLHQNGISPWYTPDVPTTRGS
jgi:Na+-transporting NADH:ubiquinone oxidoreductase subunit NqrC